MVSSTEMSKFSTALNLCFYILYLERMKCVYNCPLIALIVSTPLLFFHAFLSLRHNSMSWFELKGGNKYRAFMDMTVRKGYWH